MKITEIARTNELLSAKGKKNPINAVLYHTIDLQKIYTTNESSYKIYFTVDDDDYVSALVVTNTQNELVQMENISGKKGSITILILAILNNEYELRIKPTEKLTSAGFNWLLNTIRINRYFSITDYDNHPVEINELKKDWFENEEKIGIILRATNKLTEAMITNTENYQRSLNENSLIMPMIRWLGDQELL